MLGELSMDATANPAQKNVTCPTCYDLNPDLSSTKQQPLVLGERFIKTSLSSLKDSAEDGGCERCSVLYFGLSDMDQDWQNDHGFNPDGLSFLGDETEVHIYVRKGHSLRVFLINFDRDFSDTLGAAVTFEFYTRSIAGMYAGNEGSCLF
jgi:hypothetical protein